MVSANLKGKVGPENQGKTLTEWLSFLCVIYMTLGIDSGIKEREKNENESVKPTSSWKSQEPGRGPTLVFCRTMRR